jgi:hypothetical protein
MVTRSSYTPRARAKRVSAVGRGVLAAFSLLAVWLDPSEPSRHAKVTYTLLTAYLGYALLLILWMWRGEVPWARLGALTHLADLPALTADSRSRAAKTLPR